jgi:hypothetical protein
VRLSEEHLEHREKVFPFVKVLQVDGAFSWLIDVADPKRTWQVIVDLATTMHPTDLLR